MRRRSAVARQGLTLVETALLVCIVGVVLAVFVPTFIDRISTSKTSEASTELETLHRLSAAYYAARHRPSEEEPRRLSCLPPKAGPTPEAPSPSPTPVDFGAEDSPHSPTWRALGFSPDRPLRYRYTFQPSRAGCGVSSDPGTPLLRLVAEGDLDADGQLSHFSREATVDADGNLVPLGVLQVKDRVE